MTDREAKNRPVHDFQIHARFVGSQAAHRERHAAQFRVSLVNEIPLAAATVRLWHSSADRVLDQQDPGLRHTNDDRGVTALFARQGAMPGLDVVVFSRTLRSADYPAVSVVNSDPAESVRSLKARPGKDIWLFGGDGLFRTLLDAGLVDTVEPAVVPVLLGDGVPMLPAPLPPC